MKKSLLIVLMIVLSTAAFGQEKSPTLGDNGGDVNIDIKFPPKKQLKPEIAIPAAEGSPIRIADQQTRILQLSLENYRVSIEKAQNEAAQIQKQLTEAQADTAAAVKDALVKLGVAAEDVSKYEIALVDPKTGEMKARLKPQPPAKPASTPKP